MIKRFFIILLFTALPLTALAENYTLKDLTEEAVKNNPAIRAAYEDVKAAKAKIIQAYTPDNPEIGVKFEKVPIDTINVEDANSINYGIKQTIPFPSKLITEGASAKREAKAAANTADQTKLVTLSNLKKTYFEILLVDRMIEIEEKNQALFNKYKGIAETRYATGKSTFNDPIKASLKASSFETKLSDLKQKKESLVAMLGYFLGRDISRDSTFTREQKSNFKYDLAEFQSIAMKNQPMILSSQNRRDASKKQLSLSRKQYIPDLMTEFQYNQRDSQQDAWSASFGVSLPLWFFGNQQAKTREARSKYNAAVETYNDTTNMVASKVIDTFESIKASERIMKIYEETILPKAKADVRSAETSYLTGKLDFLNLAESTTMWKEYEIDYYQAYTNYENAIADAEVLTGTFVR